jgi:large subunit ribosomal protein L9
MAKQSQILLIEDVYPLGKSGDLVQVKPGYARNFLYPQGKAVVASKHTLRMQERLQEERAKQAAMDLEESTAIAAQLQGVQLSKEVKVDPDGHMYGSVSVTDLLKLLKQSGFTLDKQNINLPNALKKTGMHVIVVRLKEGVESSFSLRITPEGGIEEKAEEPSSKEESATE